MPVAPFHFGVDSGGRRADALTPPSPETAGVRRRAIALGPYGAKTLALGLILLAGVTSAQDGRFALEGAEIRPDKAKPGEAVTIRTKVTAKDAASGVSVDLEVKDKDDKKVAQR